MFHVHTLLLNQQLLPFSAGGGFVFTYLTCQLAACRVYVVAARFAPTVTTKLACCNMSLKIRIFSADERS